MKYVYLSLLLGTALPLAAQQPVSLLEKEIPITMRVNGVLSTKKEPVNSALARLSQEPAIRDYHQELNDLTVALKGRDGTKIRKAFAPVQTRLNAEGPTRRVQLNSFVRGLDSLLNAPVATSSEKPAMTTEPIPASDEEANVDTVGEAGTSAGGSFGTDLNAAVGDRWPWLTGLATLLALGLGALYLLARRQIARMKRREKLGSNEELMRTLRKQIQTQHEELRQMRDENDALRRQAALLAQATPPLEIVPPFVKPVPEAEEEPTPSSLARPVAEPLAVAPTPALAEPIQPATIPVPAAPEPAYAPEEDEEEDPDEITFFLSTPNRDGSFSDLRHDDFVPSQSLYQFRISNAEGTEAEFVFADDPASVHQALSSPDSYLHPVCEYTDLRLDARNIRTLRLGRARQTEPGERWELVEKARISFS